MLLNAENKDCGQDGDDVELSLPDRWIISRLQIAEREVVESIEAYRFDLAAQAIYEFTWSEYCDWYLELSKPLLAEDVPEPQQRGTRRTLVRVLEALLRLAHPMIPFITEAIWQRVASLAGKSGDTIMLQPYPVCDPRRIDADSLEEMIWLQELIRAVRAIRGEMNIKPSLKMDAVLQNATERDRARFERQARLVERLAGLGTVRHLAADEAPPLAATALIGEMKVLIPLEGLIDIEAERSRLEREIDRRTKDLERSGNKLSNSSFVERAPAEVVAKERDRVAQLSADIDKLATQLQSLG